MASKSPPDQTHEETRYLKHLSEQRIPIRICLENNQEVAGQVEFFDASFIRLTRPDAPNLFIFKHDIKYLYEAPE